MPETSLKSVQTLTSKSFRIVAEAAPPESFPPLTGIPGPKSDARRPGLAKDVSKVRVASADTMA